MLQVGRSALGVASLKQGKPAIHETTGWVPLNWTELEVDLPQSNATAVGFLKKIEGGNLPHRAVAGLHLACSQKLAKAP